MTPAGAVLGLHTGGQVEAALRDGDVVAAEWTDRQALEGLLPLVRGCLTAAHVDISRVKLIAVCCGPGSFTGLRIGVAFAKSLAQGLDIAAIGVSSFDVEYSLRVCAEGSSPKVVVVEGKRDFYYARIAPPDEVGNAVIVAGTREDVFAAAREVLGESFGAQEAARAFDQTRPAGGARAAAVATLGSAAIEAGAPGDWRRLAIEYGQRPNAVVNWERRHGRS